MQFLTFWFMFCALNNFGIGVGSPLEESWPKSKTSWEQALGLINYVSQPPKSLPLFHFNLSLRSAAVFVAFLGGCSAAHRHAALFLLRTTIELQKPGLSVGQKRTRKADLRAPSEKIGQYALAATTYKSSFSRTGKTQCPLYLYTSPPFPLLIKSHHMKHQDNRRLIQK